MKDLDEAFFESPNLGWERRACDTCSQTSIVIPLAQYKILPSLVYKFVGAVSSNVFLGL